MTSDVIRVQVKGGDKWRRANGYAIPVSHHGDTWANGNIPVYCVVYDPDSKKLFWANATQQLRRSGPLDRPNHRIYVGAPSLPLDEQVQIIWRIPEP
ncbi:DUF4365 domain-containing protein [Embleya sp. NPDC020886]|uniref:DUF4365 domain-containing protein n=1 Tax=Embleya sp. NPDC020886 TaxID=3363980 RepID=UPI0037A1DE7C